MNITGTTYCLAVILLLVGPLEAQAQHNSVAFVQLAKPYLSSGEIEKVMAADTNAFNLQTYAVQFSKVGNYKASLATQQRYIEKTKAARNVPERPKADSVNFRTFKPVNAVAAISNAAKTYHVVITNEAHYQPQNRVFTNLLLGELYREGYRYFCVEDLSIDDPIIKSKKDDGLNQRKYPLRTSGYYMDEPQYGNLVRKALKLGYTVVAYEHYASEIKDPGKRILGREEGQAKNIAEILKKDSAAKILVHCGYGHLNEKIRKSGFGLMAAFLKTDFNIDPLTVDQQDLLDENNVPYYHWANVTQPSVFVSNKGFFSDPDEYHEVDMVVVFPPTKYVNGRPDWLSYDKNRKFYFPKLNELRLKYPLMISAYVQGEDLTTAVPDDIIEIQNPQEAIALVLDQGKYRLMIRDSTGTVIEQAVNVK